MNQIRRWWWVPLLGALLCGGFTALLTANWVAGRVETAAVGALDAVGLGSSVGYVGVDGVSGIGGDGVNVVLEGPAANKAAAVEAVSARSEIDQVLYNVIDSDGAVAGGDAEADGAEVVDDTEPAVDGGDETTTAVEAVPMAVVVAVDADGIVLSGQVPDQDARDAIVAEAVSWYGQDSVTDNLQVGDEVGSEGGTLTVSGEASSEGERTEWVDAATAVATAGGLDVVDEVTVRSVDQSLNDLFELEPIEFDTGLATIRSTSIPTLDAAADLLNANPEVGPLLVVGHTDSDGTAGANQRLSEARANAVVDYLVSEGGVVADRLEAEGRGETELLVDPENGSEDKQRNRRIAWELLS